MTDPPVIPRLRQAALFRIGTGLGERFDPGFFAAIPPGPGVYRFFDRSGHLLYIGQSSGLRARIGSYRHVSEDRHPRRTLRLVSRIRTIEWELCETAADAVERERVLLLEHRPPFNRAGVWIGPPWWLLVEEAEDSTSVRLTREPQGYGHFPPGFRHVLGTLARTLLRGLRPNLPLHLYPHGLMRGIPPVTFMLPLPASSEARRILVEAACGVTAALIGKFDAAGVPDSPHLVEFWGEERERLVKHASARLLPPLPDDGSVLPCSRDPAVFALDAG